MSGKRGHNNDIFGGELGEAFEEYLDYHEHLRNKGKRKDLMRETVDTFAASMGWYRFDRPGGKKLIVRIDRDTMETRSVLVNVVDGGSGRIRKTEDGFEVDLDPEKVFDREECEEYLDALFRAMGRQPKVML